MDFTVQILGSNSALPAHGRHPSAQVLSINDHPYLIDCGEGTQIRLDKYDVRKSRINEIFISHLHGDHFFGLFGLLTTYNLLKRTHPLTIFSPLGLKKIIECVILDLGNPLNFELNIVELDHSGQKLIHSDSITNVVAFNLKHRIPTYGYSFEEVRPVRKLDGNLLDQWDVPPEFREQIRRGNDYVNPEGKTFPAKYFFEKERKLRKYAYVSDTMPFEGLVGFVEGASAIYHEATFAESERKRAEETQHSTAVQAAINASRAKVQKLLIGHFSSRYKNLDPLLKEAKAIFPNTHLAIEGKVFDVWDDEAVTD